MVPVFGFYCMTGFKLLQRLRQSQQQGRKVKYLRAVRTIISITIFGYFFLTVLFSDDVQSHRPRCFHIFPRWRCDMFLNACILLCCR